MVSRQRVFVRMAAALVLATMHVAACSKGGSGPEGDNAGKGSGTFRMALSATANGHTYHLRHASFSISGSTTVTLNTDTEPDTAALIATLVVGSYTVTLAPDWSLERADPSGPVQVSATLTSPNPVAFDITSGATTSVSFGFATDGQVVAIGQGMVAVSVNVTENGSGAGQLAVLAGVPGGLGTGDGVGRTARFEIPEAVALDGAGNIFVADTEMVRQVVLATGAVTTLAGTPGSSGAADGTGAAARFGFLPGGLFADGAGNVYVSDGDNNAIRKVVVATGEVTTFAGALGQFGFADGALADARFSNPIGITGDGAGHLYVADQTNTVIRQIDIAAGQVTTLAGHQGGFGFGGLDGVGAEASFQSPRGVALDGAGNLYVSDPGTETIRKIVLATAEVTTIAGLPENGGSDDGVGTAARFHSPDSLAFDGGNLFIVDSLDSTVRKLVVATGEVTTFLGQVGVFGSTDGSGRGVGLGFPRGITGDGAGNLYIADTENGSIRKVVIATATSSTVAGFPAPFGSADGTGAAARFGGLDGSFSDGAGNLYVSDSGNNTIRKIVLATGEVTTFAGTASTGPGATVDGVGAAARFSGPSGLAGDGAGSLFVADFNGQTIRRIDIATRAVTTLAGAPGAFGSVEGVGAAARFDSPRGLATDGAGNLYVSCNGDETIRKIVIATGEVTLFAGTPNMFGNTDGEGASALFAVPGGLATDGAGSLYVADTDNDAIRRIDLATGQVSTLAGGSFGRSDGVGAAAQFDFPEDVAADRVGNLYVADMFNHTVRKIDIATATVTTVVGTPAVSGVLTGALPARLNDPNSVTVLPGGRLAILDEDAVLVATF
jgi:sugar lactone lactonase YvrE